MLHDSILGTIGNTPVVRLNKMAPAGQTIYAKIEAFNPMASVKDRLAIAIIEDAERRGTIKPGQTVIEATSGNTGIALAAERGSGMVARAEALAKQHGWFMASQFENPANPAYHRNTTAPEILRDFAGHELDYFVSGWGTGGTMTGTGQVLKVARPGIKIIGVEPQEAALLSGNPWSPHKIQGWTPDFVPEILDPSVTAALVLVSDEESLETA